MRLAISSDPTTLDIARASDDIAQRIGRLVGEGLFELGPDLNLIPAAARSYALENEGRDLVVELDPARRWHDGRPLTIDDLVYTWRTMTDPDASAESLRDPFFPIESIEPLGGSRVRIRYDKPYPGALSAWRWPLLAAHHDARASAPLGCGPWRFGEWIAGERVILEPNPEHPSWAPQVSALHMEVIPTYGGQLDALLAEELDVAGLYPDAWKSVKDDAAFNERFEIHAFRIPYFFYVAWRIDSPGGFFQDARVRRAMSHAVPREDYLQNVASGLGVPGVTCIHPDNWAYNPDLSPWPHDRARAEALLDEAGWQRGSDGVRTKAGRAFRFKLSYPAGNTETERIASFVQSALGEVGVTLVLDPVEWTLLQSRVAERDFEATMLGWYLDLDPDPYALLHSSQIEGGANYAGLDDPRVDALIEEGRSTTDRAARTRAYRELQEIVHEEEPVTILFYPQSRVATTRQLEGFSVSPVGYLVWRPGPSNWRWRS